MQFVGRADSRTRPSWTMSYTKLVGGSSGWCSGLAIYMPIPCPEHDTISEIEIDHHGQGAILPSRPRRLGCASAFWGAEAEGFPTWWCGDGDDA